MPGCPSAAESKANDANGVPTGRDGRHPRRACAVAAEGTVRGPRRMDGRTRPGTPPTRRAVANMHRRRSPPARITASRVAPRHKPAPCCDAARRGSVRLPHRRIEPMHGRHTEELRRMRAFQNTAGRAPLAHRGKRRCVSAPDTAMPRLALGPSTPGCPAEVAVAPCRIPHPLGRPQEAAHDGPDPA